MSIRLRSFQRLGLATLFVTLAAGVVQAQQSSTQVTIPQRGVTPAGFYGVSDIETIDSVSGNLSLKIPITSLPAGRTGATASLGLIYNSSIYAWNGEQLVNSDFISPGDSGGWHYSFDYNFTNDYIPYDNTNCNSSVNFAYFRYRLVTPDGASHVLFIRGRSDDWHGYYPYPSFNCAPPAEGGTVNFYTADGTYLRMIWNGVSGAWTVYLPDGHIVTGQGQSTTRIVDRNGNGFSISRQAESLTTTLTDDLGRTITIQHAFGSGQHFAQDFITQTVTDTSSGTSTQPALTWTVNWDSVALDFDHKYVCTIDSSGFCNGSNLSGLMVTSVVLPSQLNSPTPLQYTFTYNKDVSPVMQWGQLSSMQLPTGALVQYTYATQPWGPLPGVSVAPFPIVSKILTWQDQADNSAQRNESTSYSFSNTQSTFTNPDGGSETHLFFDTYNTNADPSTGLVYKVTEPTGDIVERVWSTNVPLGSTSWPPLYHLPGNSIVQMELTTKAGAALLTSAKTFTYDRNGNKKTIVEYDFTSSPGTVIHNGNVPTGFNGGTVARTTNNTYLNGAVTAISGSSGASNDDFWAYWNNHTPQLLNLISQTTVSGSGPGSNVSFVYDNGGLTHGNITQENRWDSQQPQQPNTTETIFNTYDSYAADVSSLCANAASIGTFGNLAVRQNERGIRTVFCYDANGYHMVRRVEAAQTADARTFDYVYDASLLTANLQSMIDVDHSITRSFRWDAFSRNVWETEGNVHTTQTAYDDAARQISVKSDRDSNLDGLLVETTLFDQLGRTWRSQDWAGNYVQRRYLVPPQTGFSYELVSNPYITQQETTMGWTRTKRDVQGRVVEVNHFSGSGLPAPWGSSTTSTGAATVSYSANCSTAADEAQVSRTNCLDGLGRLYQVTENGISATTTYTYDALDNLTSVTKPGVAARTFAYSSLSRLTSANNPETGPISYTYDPGGNLHTKTDSRITPVTVLYLYNNLDQVIEKRYSDTTPWVQNTYNKSWLTQVVAGLWSYNYAYDSIGRVKDASQVLAGGATYSFHVTYKPLIGIDAITYPNSGRVVQTTYDVKGRPSGLTGQGGTNPQTTYVNTTTYQTDGAIQTQTLANGNLVVNHCCDNPRLQTQTIQAGNLLTLSYGYSPTNNNGNVTSQIISRPGLGSWSQAYGYDGVNRLTTVQESGSGTWSRTYGYDPPGNQRVDSNTGLNLSPFTPTSASNFDASNHLNIQNSSYDGGSQKQIGGFQFQYDAENRMISSTFNQTTTQYTYDALGHRVTKTAGGQTTTYVYDPFGNLAQEYGSTQTTTSTIYPIADALGSTRVAADSSGAEVRCYDYVPFGEEIPAGTAGRTAPCFGNATYPATASDVLNQKFTGKERDAETELDFFLSRYYSGAQGRFTSSDEPFAGSDQNNPQSFNLYGYVQNNPSNGVDPDGHDVRVCVTNDEETQKNCFNLSDAKYRQLYSAQNGQQGINLPGGPFPMGNITCGGQKCGTATHFYPSLEDQTLSLLTLIEGARSVVGLGRVAYRGITNLILRDTAEETTVVIGKTADLEVPGALRPSETSLDLPNLGNPKANWAQNSSRLRQAMNEGRPIRDISAEPLVNGNPGKNTGFLRAERNLLENHGWKYRDGYWYPPK